MKVLVGSTGFVGSNLNASGSFDAAYHSKNIRDAYGTNPDLLVYAGLRAEKYLANHDPEQDWMQILQAEENIRRINPGKLVLISTIDVFPTPRCVDEHSAIDTKNLHPYGMHRYRLEQWVRENYADALIVRLPGLFGKNIKKNFIYDLIHLIPFMLKEEKFAELSVQEPALRAYYQLQENGFYRVNVAKEEEESLRERFRALGYSALNFTDSRSVYQFYNLVRLWRDIQTALQAGIELWHPATEPVSAGEIYEFLTGEQFKNELDGMISDYDYRTVYAEVFGGEKGYIVKKQQVLKEIRIFVEGEKYGKK